MEADYKNYYWQNDVIRFRPLKIEDWVGRALTPIFKCKMFIENISSVRL
jgi:hypothetical protein